MEAKDQKGVELAYQARRAGMLSVAATQPQLLARYRELRHWRLYRKEYMLHELGDLRGKAILDFGCGEGELSTQLALLGARVTGIDISPELIEVARQRAELDGVSAEFIAVDILESLPGRFDIVIANAVLHHLDIGAVVPRLIECLHPDGLIAITEPISFSPLLGCLRNALPVSADASPGEHPLTIEEFRSITGRLKACRVAYFGLLGRLARFIDGRALRLALQIDRCALELFPALSRFCSTVVIVGRPLDTN